MIHKQVIGRVPEFFRMSPIRMNSTTFDTPLDEEHIDFFYEYYKPYRYNKRDIVRVINDGEERMAICTGHRPIYIMGRIRGRMRRRTGDMVMILLTKKGEKELQDILVEEAL